MPAHMLTAGAARVLHVLRDCAVAGRGWRRRGFRGWLFVDELPADAAAMLPRLARCGLVQAEPAAEPGRPTALALHRITIAGEAALAALEGRPAAEVGAPDVDDAADAAVVYLPVRAWAALWALQRAPHASGWTSLAEVRARAAASVCAADLVCLVRRRLAVSARGPEGAPREPGRYFRATRAGAALRLLELRTEADDPRSFDRVQATTAPEPPAPAGASPRLYRGPFFGSGG